MYFYEKNCSVYNHSAAKLDSFYAIYLLLPRKWLRNAFVAGATKIKLKNVKT